MWPGATVLAFFETWDSMAPSTLDFQSPDDPILNDPIFSPPSAPRRLIVLFCAPQPYVSLPP